MENKLSIHWGYAASEITKRNASKLYVNCPEFTPLASGELTDANNEHEVKIFNEATGMTYEKKVVSTTSIYAEYFGALVGSTDVPDVCKDEQIILINFAGTDVFYWLPADRLQVDNVKRLVEHVRLSCNNRTKLTDPIDDDSTYYLEIDTKYHRHIVLKTSKKRGEKYAYTIAIDAETNTILLSDDINNTIGIESNNSRTYMTNSDGSLVDLTGTVGRLYAKDGFYIESNLVNIKAGGIVLDGPTSITETLTLTKNLAVGTTITVTGDVTAAAYHLG